MFRFMSSVPNIPLVKPLLRGHFHQAAFFYALGACTLLIVQSSGVRQLIAAVIYSISLCGMFGVSALYHRKNWQPEARMWMKRLDHCAIFVLIAGTGTPISMLAIADTGGRTLLAIIWIAAIVGVLQSLFWIKAPKWISALLYIVMGWLAVPYVKEMSTALGSANIALILTGGVVYTLGAVIYALKRPNPSPKYFGYHEIFHILVIVAAILHFIVVAQLIIH